MELLYFCFFVRGKRKRRIIVLQYVENLFRPNPSPFFRVHVAVSFHNFEKCNEVSECHWSLMTFIEGRIASAAWRTEVFRFNFQELDDKIILTKMLIDSIRSRCFNFCFLFILLPFISLRINSILSNDICRDKRDFSVLPSHELSVHFRVSNHLVEFFFTDENVIWVLL